MRSASWRSVRAIALAVCFSGCADRTLEPEVDYSEEVERICEGLCTIDLQCVEMPLVTYDECIEVCEEPGTILHRDDRCGDAYRAYYDCIAGISTCDVWETANAELCAEQFDARNDIVSECGAEGQGG